MSSTNYNLIQSAKHALDSGYWKIPFPRPLEAAYQKGTQAERTRHYRFALMIGAIVYLLYTFADLTYLSENYWQSLAVRVFVGVPIIALIAWLIRVRDNSTINDIVLFLGSIPLVATIVYITTLSIEEGQPFYYTGTMIILCYINLVLRLSFWWAVLLSVSLYFVSIATYYYTGLSPEYLNLVIVDDGSVIATTLLANYFMHIQERRGYLRRLLLESSNQKALLAQQQLEVVVDVDQLTGVYNRRALDKLEAIDLNTESGVIFIDIDHFKQFNDIYGHKKGDDCLVIVSEVIRCAIREDDYCIRYGGEEFVVVMIGATAERTQQVAQNVIDQVVLTQIEHSGSQYGYVTVSAGVAFVGNDGDISIDQLIHTADKALYSAKKAGRNRMVLAEK